MSTVKQTFRQHLESETDQMWQRVEWLRLLHAFSAEEHTDVQTQILNAVSHAKDALSSLKRAAQMIEKESP